MKCRHVEFYLLEIEESAFFETIKSEVQEHLKKCPHCVLFAEHLHKLRGYLKEIETAQPSQEVIDKTVQACRAHLLTATPVLKAKREPFQIPKLIWVALAGLLTLTLIFLSPALLNKILEEPLPYPDSIAVIIVIQNIVTLFFAPILLKNKLGEGRLLYFK